MWKDPRCEDLFNTLVNSEEKFPILTVEDGVQKLEHVSWGDVFNIIRSEHWHNVDKATCPHHESLFEHLCSCAEICYTEAKRRDLDNAHFYFYLGLLHDIGKPGTRMIRGKRTSFKGHALVGGSLMQHLWSDKLGDKIDVPALVWGEISTVTDVHMCGYFPDMCEEIHLDSFRLLSFSVRLMLQILRIGDVLSLVPQPGERSACEEECVRLVETQENFELKTTVPILNYAEKYQLDNGILIQIQGASGSGKSTLRKYIKSYLNMCSVVEVVRDDVMVETVLKSQGRPFTQDYSAELYRECYEYYQEKKPILSKRVNGEMMSRIQEALVQGLIVITDTLATAHAVAAMNILPKKEMLSTFKISFWCSRGPELFTDENSMSRHGMDLNTQVKIHGNRQLMNPLLHLEDFAAVTSITEAKKIDTKRDWIRPHLSLSTNWNNVKRREINGILDHVKRAYDYCQSLPRKLVYGTSLSYSLQQLVEMLFVSGGIEEVKDFFSRYAYQVSVVNDNIVGIKYIDGINRIWRTTWAREARGRFYYFDPETRKIIPLKETLQRGAEMLTRSHKNVDETQDMTDRDFSHLDDTQQELISLLKTDKNEQIDGILSCKVDGMLLILNFYPPSCDQYKIIKNLLTSDKLYSILEDGTIVTVSTQGTLFAGQTVFAYIVTAFVGELKIEIPKTTPLKAWKALEPEIRSWFEKLYLTLNKKEKMLNLAAEMVCKNRTTYNGTVHTELAVKYDSSFVALLGIYYDGKYIPHADLPETLSLITHPGFVRITNTSQIHEAVNELEEVVVGGKQLEDFAEKWFGDKKMSVHAEGFVYLHMTDKKIYDYSKIKLPVYYMLHKIKKENISQLLSLPKSVDDYFPSLVALRKFTSDLHGLMVELSLELEIIVTTFLTSNDEEIKSKRDEWIVKLNDRAQARIGKFYSEKENMKDDELKVVYAICTREGLDFFKEKFVEKALENFGILNSAGKRDSVIALCVDLLVRVRPWLGKDHVSSVVGQLIDKQDKIISVVWNLFVATQA